MVLVLYTDVFLDDLNDISSTQVHLDLISGLHGIKRTLEVHWTCRHIYGQQEDTSGTALDQWTLLNIKCDYKETYV